MYQCTGDMELQEKNISAGGRVLGGTGCWVRGLGCWFKAAGVHVCKLSPYRGLGCSRSAGGWLNDAGMHVCMLTHLVVWDCICFLV